MSRQDVLDTIWEVPDDLWIEIEPLIEELDPPKATGRKRADARKMLDAIIFRMRSGCQWNRLPKCLGDDSTIHRTFQRWESSGVFPQVWAVIQAHCESWVVWTGSGNRRMRRQSAFGGDEVGRNPTDRGKPGTKRSILVEATADH